MKPNESPSIFPKQAEEFSCQGREGQNGLFGDSAHWLVLHITHGAVL